MVNIHDILDTRQMVQVNIDLTITDNDTDIALNPDGTFPTKEDIAADVRINTRTHIIHNPDTNQWQRVTTRHAPFGMPLSQQQGDKWWLAAPNPRLVALEEQADADLRRSIDNLTLRVQFEQARHAYTHAMDTLRLAVAREIHRGMVLRYLQNEVRLATIRVQMAIVQVEMIRERAARARQQAAQQQSQAGGGDAAGSDDASSGDESSADVSSFDGSLVDDSSDDASSVDDYSTDASSFDGLQL